MRFKPVFDVARELLLRLASGHFQYDKFDAPKTEEHEMIKWFKNHVGEKLGHDVPFFIYRRREYIGHHFVWVWYAVTDFEKEFGKWTRNTISIEENTIKYIVYGDGNNDAPH